MKVLFVNESSERPHRFGVDLQPLVRGLKSRGHVLGVLWGPPSDENASPLTKAFDFHFPLQRRGGAQSVQAALERFRPSLVCVHVLVDPHALETLMQSAVPRVRMVQDHDSSEPRGIHSLVLVRRICARALSPFTVFPGRTARNSVDLLPVRWIRHTISRSYLELNRGFHRLIVSSHYRRGELIRQGFPAAKIELRRLPNGESEPPDRRLTRRRNLLIYCGQIEQGKGVDLVLNALARVRQPFECIILGDGSHRPYCEELSHRLGLAGQVRFAGYLPTEQVQGYYRECRAALMTSLWPEPFGMAGLDAMHFGLPVVAFDSGAIREWVVDGVNGYLVPGMDPGAYAARVEELLADQGRARQMGVRGLRMVSKRDSFPEYITGLEGLFTRVVAEAQRRVNA
jgi:glycosyltransferase involved in cell wall biosynthesis